MGDAYRRWTVLPHGSIDKLEDNLWFVEGSLPSMELKRVMTLARMKDGRVVIHNAIALEEPLMEQVEAWGEPAFLVVPNGWHRLDARVYKDRYPRIKVLCPRGSRARVERVVPVDGDYDSFEADETVQLQHLQGIRDAEGILRVRSGDKLTLVFNDMVFNLPHGKGAMGLIFRIMGSTGGPRVTRFTKFLVIKDKKALRSDLARIANEPGLQRIIVSHGTPMDENAAQVLRDIAARV